MSDEEFDIFDGYDDEDDVELDPANKAPSDKVERFKGKKGESYRVSLLYFHPLAQRLYLAARKKAKKEGTEVDKAAVKAALDKALAKRAEELDKSVDELAEWEKLDLRKAQFKKYQSHYKEGFGYVLSRMGKDGDEADKVWSMLGDPKQYYSTILLVYPTDNEGNVEKELLGSRTKVQPWRFSRGVWNRLIDVEQKLKGLDKSLSSMDLLLQCKNDQFQNFDIDFAGDALWQTAPKLRNKFLPQAVAMYEKLIDARELSTADLKIKLGIGGDSGEDVSDDEMEDFLEGV